MQKTLRVGVLANGQVTSDQWLEQQLQQLDLLICADGGTNHAYRLKYRPALIIGDLDSINPSALAFYRDQRIPIKKYPVEKDDTDLKIALKAAIQAGADEVIILGATGNRLDHSLGAISLLAFLQTNGVKGIIRDECNEITLTDATAIINGLPGETVSLLPLTTKVTGITTENLKYQVKDGTFTLGNPYGISNVIVHSPAKVTVQTGLLLIIKSRE
ncbi:MAG TPA: thiamine diphosphokinase [Desulfobacteria bacterium]|nr:thiamine diphosphokinase [Desulfobacteria bacterium]